MKLNDFKLECYFADYEFSAPYLLAQSDCESMSTKDLLQMEKGAEEAYLNLWLGYTETWGDPDLRKEIASLYQGMTPDNILVFHGAQEGIFAYMNLLLEPGDHMICMRPGYQSAYEVAESNKGLSYSSWWLKDEGDTWTLDFDELEDLVRENTKVLAVNTPNNPTGYAFSREEMERLVDFCKTHDLYLFADEVYKGLEFASEAKPWFADLYPKAASLGVLSKAYGLAGLRVGWIASKDRDLLENLAKFKHYLSICDSKPSEFLAKLALRHGEEILSRNRKIIEDNMALGEKFFQKYGDIFEEKKFSQGPIGFHKLKLDLPVEDFCRQAVEKKGVLLLPGTMYDLPGTYFRMGYGRKNFPEALEKLEEFLDENILK